MERVIKSCISIFVLRQLAFMKFTTLLRSIIVLHFFWSSFAFIINQAEFMTFHSILLLLPSVETGIVIPAVYIILLLQIFERFWLQ
jgi:hypothetical protein